MQPIFAITVPRRAPSRRHLLMRQPLAAQVAARAAAAPRRLPATHRRDRAKSKSHAFFQALFHYRIADLDSPDHHGRSEEHTSELQSLMRISYAVFCLKKKKKHEKI